VKVFSNNQEEQLDIALAFKTIYQICLKTSLKFFPWPRGDFISMTALHQRAAMKQARSALLQHV
jgi:hypothetical protein